MEEEEERVPQPRAPVQERDADVAFAPERGTLVLVLALQVWGLGFSRRWTLNPEP